MTRALTPFRLIAAGLLLLAVVVGAAWALPSDRYIFLPDPAHPVAGLVTVPKDRVKPAGQGGGIYFVDVIVRKARFFEKLFPGIHDGATLYPERAILPKCVSDSQQRRADLHSMTQSQETAAAVALRAAGYPVTSRATGVEVDEIDCESPARGKLQPSDLLTGVDGKPVRTIRGLFEAMQKHKPGDVVRLAVRDADGLHTVSVKTFADPKDKNRALIGFRPAQGQQTKLPFPVAIDAGGVGGPSAGLAFALQVAEKLGRDVDHGYRVAATGTIAPDGSVGPIGGVKQKTIGARRADVDVFLVPAGENAQEARRYAEGLRIIPVESFRQALRALATLPPRQ